MNSSNICFNLSINPNQGYGFSEFASSWPLSELNISNLKIIDNNNKIRYIVFDNSNLKFYEIGLRENYSDITLANLYRDKVSLDKTTYEEITPEITFKSDIGESENYIIQHDEGRFHLRPISNDYINVNGFTSQGYLSGIQFSIQTFVNDDPLKDYYTLTNISKNNDLIYDKNIEGNRLQTKITSTKSGFRLISRQQNYIVKDIRYNLDDRITTENDYQYNISNPLFWITRGETPTKELITNTDLVGIITQTEGPDLKTNSALYISGTEINIGTTINTNSKSIVMWGVNNIDDTLTISPVYISGKVGNNLISSPSGFFNVYSYIDDSLKRWRMLYASGITASGLIKLGCIQDTSFYLFDIRVIEGNIIPNLAYMFNDIKNNSGNNTCPLF
jgi:hypothetical protein